VGNQEEFARIEVAGLMTRDSNAERAPAVDMPGRGLEPLRISPPDPKSGASANFATLAEIPATVPAQILAQSPVLQSHCPANLPHTRQTYTLEYEHWIGIGLLREVCLVDK
jgi:hypothetical protein